MHNQNKTGAAMITKNQRKYLWLSALLLASCALDARIEAIQALSGDPINGESVYFNICEECHAQDLKGTELGPSLIILVPRLKDEKILRAVIIGKDEMPAFGDDLLDQEISDVLSYVRQEAP
jgi:mono/diheme cytochrome c family protein